MLLSTRSLTLVLLNQWVKMENGRSVRGGEGDKSWAGETLTKNVCWRSDSYQMLAIMSELLHKHKMTSHRFTRVWSFPTPQPPVQSISSLENLWRTLRMFHEIDSSFLVRTSVVHILCCEEFIVGSFVLRSINSSKSYLYKSQNMSSSFWYMPSTVALNTQIFRPWFLPSWQRVPLLILWWSQLLNVSPRCQC